MTDRRRDDYDVQLKMANMPSNNIDHGDGSANTDGFSAIDSDATVIDPEFLPGFIQMLKTDDVEQFRSWTPDQQSLFITGRFDYTNCPNPIQGHVAKFEIPFNLASGYAALNMMKLFLERGVDVTRRDIGGYNVLHILAAASAKRRENEEDYVPVTEAILDNVKTETLMVLCTQEEDRGLRPLELACLEGAFAVYNCLVLKQGYICGEPRMMGLSTVHPYDISDYSSGGNFRRTLRSPLKMAIFVDRDGFDSLAKFGTLDLPVVHKWYTHNFLACLPFLIIWWIYKITFLCAVAYLDPTILLYESTCTNFSRTYILGDQESKMQFKQCLKWGNFTEDAMKLSLELNRTVEIWSYIMIVADIVEFVLRIAHADRRRVYKSVYMRSFAAYTKSYRLSMFGLYVVAVLAPIIGKSHSGGAAYNQLLFIKAFQLPLCLYSMLHIAEFLPVIGVFAITIQRMIKSLLIFLLFLMPVKILFAQFFTFFASDEGFTDIEPGMYLTFLMDMGSYDFGETPALVVKIVHVFYFLVMIILLFNYLIAVLSIVAEETSEGRVILVKLRRLQMISEVEERVAHWFWALVRKYTKRRNKTILIA